MSSVSKLENLANEILLDIFDYLRPSDLLRSFSLLNKRFEALLLQYHIHLDLSTNFSLEQFHRFTEEISKHYTSTICSIRLSNVDTCGNIRLFLQRFSPLDQIFPNLSSIDLDQPDENEFKQFVQCSTLKTISLKFNRLNEQQIPIGILFENPSLTTCVLLSDDTIAISKFQSHHQLQRLLLNSFYLNDLHTLFNSYPALEHLTIQKLLVNFRGYLPPFQSIRPNVQTIHFHCFYTVRFDYLAYLLGFFPGLVRLTIAAVGKDFLDADRWMALLQSLEHLRSLSLDLKAIFDHIDSDLPESFQNPFWHRWPIAIDYSEDNGKVHLFTLPYRSSSFIGTIHTQPILPARKSSFRAVKDLYLKTNHQMDINAERFYPNVRALQIYQNAWVTMDPPSFLKRIESMIDLTRLVHFELFIVLSPPTFFYLLERMKMLKYFKTDYRILMVLTDHFQHEPICDHLHRTLDKLVIRRDELPISDQDRFLQVFSNLKHLKFNLYSMRDLRTIASQCLKAMENLQTLQIWLNHHDEQQWDKPKWQGMMNNISYEIAEKHIKIWK